MIFPMSGIGVCLYRLIIGKYWPVENGEDNKQVDLDIKFLKYLQKMKNH